MSEHRETANADMYQTIPRLAGDSASGRAEEIRSFSQKNVRCTFFCEKETKQHAAAGESNLASGQTPGLISHRVLRITAGSLRRSRARAP
jgi:hypothetical protein